MYLKTEKQKNRVASTNFGKKSDWLVCPESRTNECQLTHCTKSVDVNQPGSNKYHNSNTGWKPEGSLRWGYRQRGYPGKNTWYEHIFKSVSQIICWLMQGETTRQLKWLSTRLGNSLWNKTDRRSHYINFYLRNVTSSVFIVWQKKKNGDWEHPMFVCERTRKCTNPYSWTCAVVTWHRPHDNLRRVYVTHLKGTIFICHCRHVLKPLWQLFAAVPWSHKSIQLDLCNFLSRIRKMGHRCTKRKTQQMDQR